MANPLYGQNKVDNEVGNQVGGLMNGFKGMSFGSK